ncbi:MAG: transferase, partial [Thermoplasmatales archaeon]|nr:transferase [Thermoplasmatales archaeon]
GPNVVLTNAKYPLSIKAKEFLEGVIIGRNAKIGANATILPGVIIGDNTLVGAGSVVTKSTHRDMVMAGNPAKIVGNIRDVTYPNGEEAYGDEK